MLMIGGVNPTRQFSFLLVSTIAKCLISGNKYNGKIFLK